MSEYYGCRFCGYVVAINIHDGKKIVNTDCSGCNLPLFPISAEVFQEYASKEENRVEVHKLIDDTGKEIGTGTSIIPRW